eukprot:8693473-Ditylum_brightwellii.AAC.1
MISSTKFFTFPALQHCPTTCHMEAMLHLVLYGKINVTNMHYFSKSIKISLNFTGNDAIKNELDGLCKDNDGVYPITEDDEETEKDGAASSSAEMDVVTSTGKSDD